jgi:hypothetical protein
VPNPSMLPAPLVACRRARERRGQQSKQGAARVFYTLAEQGAEPSALCPVSCVQVFSNSAILSCVRPF